MVTSFPKISGLVCESVFVFVFVGGKRERVACTRPKGHVSETGACDIFRLPALRC